MSPDELFEKAAAWALQQGRFITSLHLCDEFNISLPMATRMIRKLITHPRVTAEAKRETCIANDMKAQAMLMVLVTKVVREPMGPPKPAKASKPTHPRAIPAKKDEKVVSRLKELVARMPR
ncbi:hypothetical protein GL272_21285 [Aeromonas veronii]|uniref:hypothetical protein n=1 Tax=Aeromonas veronii TaxID=654 RepID=UPI001C5A6571|nr:hypothetical protein [Aeromonas veronii]MBW3779408.1 hypothetical protein [Aeromonas veronii]